MSDSNRKDLPLVQDVKDDILLWVERLLCCCLFLLCLHHLCLNGAEHAVQYQGQSFLQHDRLQAGLVPFVVNILDAVVA